MPDACSDIWHIAVAAYTDCEGDGEGEPLGAALDALFAPGNRDVLVAALVARGVLVHAGCWDAPHVTDEQVEEAENAYIAARDAYYDDSTDENRKAYMAASDKHEWLQEAQDRVTVYYEDDDRPEDAVPLYRVAGDV